MLGGTTPSSSPRDPLQPWRGLARAFNRHERRTDSSEKSNNPSVAAASRDPAPGTALGVQGGHPPAPCPTMTWAAGDAAIYFSTSPLLRQGPSWAHPLLPTRCLPAWCQRGGAWGQRGDSSGTLSCARPCRLTLAGRCGCGQCRGHGTSVPGPAGWAHAGPVPARIPPAPRPPSSPATSPAILMTRHMAVCAARRAGSAPGQSHPV